MNRIFAFLVVVSSLFNYKSMLASASVLQKVDASKVCMVTNRVFAEEQIPIAIDKRTYYGCCQMCKHTLQYDAAARFAIDPVSGESVDKSMAFIAARPDGSVVYFKNQETYKHYVE